ncbi:MAG: hypothetical protein ABIQ95_01890 [Bdellovibrionia bacterium]
MSNSVFQIAVDTLSTLNDYSEVLEDLSVKASELVGQTEFQDRFLKLIEGIETFAESIAQVKTVLHTGHYDNAVVLESDLASILKELLECQEKGNLEHERNLLKVRLPENLTQWRITGLLAIQYSRDC